MRMGVGMTRGSFVAAAAAAAAADDDDDDDELKFEVAMLYHAHVHGCLLSFSVGVFIFICVYESRLRAPVCIRDDSVLYWIDTLLITSSLQCPESRV
jgi:hypothetical protein